MVLRRETLALLLCLGAGRVAWGQALEDARALHRAGEFPRALELYRAVVERTLGSDPEAAATAFNNICVIQTSLGSHEAALAACDRAIELRRRLDDRRRLARTLNNKAIVLQDMGRYRDAKAEFRKALRINQELGEELSEVLNFSNLGALAILEGHYGEALVRHARAAELLRRNESEDWARDQLGVALVNQGVVYERLGAPRRALEAYVEADPLVPLEAGEQRALLLVNLGVAYRDLGDPVRALELFDEGAAIFRDLGVSYGLSNALLNRGVVLARHLSRPDAAEESLRRALQIAEEHGELPEMILDLVSLGELFVDQRRFAEAQSMFERCRELAKEAGSSEGLWSSLAGLAWIRSLAGDTETAEEFFAAAIAEIDRVRGNIAESGLRTGYFGGKRSVFERAVTNRLKVRDANSAPDSYFVAQQAKARSLLDRLGHSEDGTDVGQPHSAADVQRSLGDGVLYEYFEANGELRLWRLDAHTVDARTLGPVGPIYDRVAWLYDQLRSGSEPDRFELANLAEDLGLSALPGANSLFFAPDGALKRLPFEVLEIGGKALIERAEVQYLPSGSSLVLLEEGRRRKNERMFLGIGDPRFDQTNLQLFGGSTNLGRLPNAVRELETASRGLGGDSLNLIGGEATETRVQREFESGAKVIHLAAHAVAQEGGAGGAAILLGSSSSDDGLLFPPEIAKAEIPAELVVLAACRTAASGDGVDALFTLTGSFLAAGASSVLATLWDVGDEETAAFMEQFYFELSRGRAPSEALQRTKIRFRLDPRWSHPAYWSGYVLSGSAGAIRLRPRPWERPLLVATTLLAILGLSFFLVGGRFPDSINPIKR